ncbi:MAG: 30S ribosome-binding factor RbfA [Rhodobacteraceae bacterium]|nr:30S ribosome-binding factor RbfA [Paracoccaceae bacterium]
MSKGAYSDHRGPSQRQLRVAELLRRRLSEVLARGEVHDPELNAMSITVGEVRASPDLKVATAFVMPLGGGEADHALEVLKANRSEIRRAVTKGLNLKYSPDLRFVLDDTYDRMDDTRRLLDLDNVRRDLETD